MSVKPIKSKDVEKIIEDYYHVEGVDAYCVWSDRISSIWHICNTHLYPHVPMDVRINRPYVTLWSPVLIEV